MESKEEITTKIKDHADIVQVIGENVELKRTGGRFLGLCPFHGEKTPSFSVHPGKQFFHCFGCGESGDVFSFVMKFHSLSFPEALKNLADKYKIPLPEKKYSKEEKILQQQKQAMYSVNSKAASLFQRALQGKELNGNAQLYLGKRKIPLEFQQKYGLGYAPATDQAGWNFLGSKFSSMEKQAALDVGLLAAKEKGGTYDRFRDRILFPILDISGQVCGFGGRIVGEGQPKYMNSPESPVYNKSRLLLGLYQAKEAIARQNQVIIVEGNFDMLSLVVHGCENVVAPLGTSLTREQIRLLKKFTSRGILLFDGDQAGLKAAMRVIPFFLAEQFDAKVALLPEGHDPDTYIQQYGRERLLELISSAEDLSEFVLSTVIEEYGLSLEGKAKIVSTLQPMIQEAGSSLQRSIIIGHIAERLQLPADELHKQLEKNIQPVPPPIRSEEPPPHGSRMVKATALTPPQKRLVNFMVFHPDKMKYLEEAGIREVLTGSMGEIIFLQLRQLLCNGANYQPEDLLSSMSEGPERKVVADMLLGVFEISGGDDGEEADCIEYLRRHRLQDASAKLVREITRMQNSGDFTGLNELLLKKQQVDRELKGELG